jgi:hypothetical protein
MTTMSVFHHWNSMQVKVHSLKVLFMELLRSVIAQRKLFCCQAKTFWHLEVLATFGRGWFFFNRLWVVMAERAGDHRAGGRAVWRH